MYRGNTDPMDAKRMNTKKLLLVAALIAGAPLFACSPGPARIPITVEGERPGTPVTFGIPFPKGALGSTGNVRVLDGSGQEIASQVTPVTTWGPEDGSLKWIWVDFFTDGSGRYTVEYGPEVRRTAEVDSPIRFVNNQRQNGFAEIDTGPLRVRVEKGGSGFVDRVEFNPAGEGFLPEHLIAEGIGTRGSFLDLVDAEGVDASSAVVHQTFIERGSGPMHAILRIEGEYRYQRPEHPASPFVTYIHAYAGRAHLKVLHTITYTGNPDRGAPLEGRQHRDVATQGELIVDEFERSRDPGITEPDDMIASAGLGLAWRLDGEPVFRTGLSGGRWWERGEPILLEEGTARVSGFSVLQTGPDADGIPPIPGSGPDERIGGFAAAVASDRLLAEAERAEGWIDLSDGERGIGIGVRGMLEEYPNQLALDLEGRRMHAYIWPPDEPPKGFQRANRQADGGMVGNFARGITKTTELVFNFHDGNEDIAAVREAAHGVLDPPVAHAPPAWYRDSGVYGTFASADNRIPALERGLQHKFRYMHFNRDWEPWYGMFDHGDLKTYYRGGDWVQWGNNEPAQDFQWWFNFMRTGNRDDYLQAEAMSRHTMDVDNLHWPTGPVYRGDTNAALDYWRTLEAPAGSPYVGMGTRHTNQQAVALYTAHVWIAGWLASYYLGAYHRGLDVARLTGEYYRKRVFGEHGLTGRRLYLSVWNLAELYDATREDIHLEELRYRLNRVLELQKTQGGRMVVDRFGYSQHYLTHGLDKYLQLFDDREVELRQIEHARSLLAVPPLDHDMESYLASIHPLVVGYDLTGSPEFLTEACRRAAYLRTDEMPQPFGSYTTQRQLVSQMEAVSHLPGRESDPFAGGRMPNWAFSSGIRVFGWTHAFGVPYLVDRLQSSGWRLDGLPCT